MKNKEAFQKKFDKKNASQQQYYENK